MNQTQPGSVTAVVVAFNGGPALQECVASLLSQTIPLEIIVVDNASTDGSIDDLRQFGDTVRVIRRDRNGGYAAGANEGWHAASGDWIAVLNQDLVMTPDCIERLRDEATASPVEALVTPKLVLKADPTIVNAIGNEVHLSGVAWCNGLNSAASRWRGVVDVTAISGAMFMTSRALFAALGGLEERYFMYYEDIDLSMRARLRGAVCLAVCEAVATHDWRLTVSAWKFELLERNRMALWRRCIGGAPRMLLPVAQAETMGWLYAAIKGRSYLRAKWRAWRSPIVLSRVQGSNLPMRPSLSNYLPYAEMFPERRSVAWLGRVIDQVVARASNAPSQDPHHRR